MPTLGFHLAAHATLLAEATLHPDRLGVFGTHVPAAYAELIQEVAHTPLLRQEYLICENLSRKGMDRDLVREYVEANLRELPQGTGLSQRQHLLEKLGCPTVAAPESSPLDQAIATLITETLTPVGRRRVSAYFDALGIVCESLCQPESDAQQAGDDNLAESETQLEERLRCLSETEQELLGVLNGADEKPRQALYERYLLEAKDLLAHYPDSEAHQRISAMCYQPETAENELMDLHELLYGNAD